MPRSVLDRLDEQVRSGVEGGVDPVHPRDPADVAGDVHPEVAGDGEDGDRLGGGVEAGHHRHVAALAAAVGRVAERVDLLLLSLVTKARESEPTSRRLKGCCGVTGRGDQVLGVDLLDLVEAVVGVEVEPAGTGGGQEHDSGRARRARAGASGAGASLSFLRDLRSSAWRSARDGSARSPRDPGREAPGSRARRGSRTRKYLAGAPGSLRPCISIFPTSCSSCAQSVRRLAQDKVKPRARAIDKEGAYPADIFEAFRDAGLLGLCIPAEYGGSGGRHPRAGHRHRGSGQVLQHRRADAPADPPAHGAGHDRRDRGAEEALPARHLRRVAAGRLRAVRAPGGQRRHGDADPGACPTTGSDGGWVLNGTKCWMSGVREADWYTVFAKTSDPASRAHDSVTAFIVERAWDGVDVGRTDHKMGVRGVDTGRAPPRPTCTSRPRTSSARWAASASPCSGSTPCARSWRPAASGWPRAR